MVEAANYFKKTSEAACFFLKLDEEPRMGANGLNHEWTRNTRKEKPEPRMDTNGHELFEPRMDTNCLNHEWARMG